MDLDVRMSRMKRCEKSAGPAAAPLHPPGHQLNLFGSMIPPVWGFRLSVEL